MAVYTSLAPFADSDVLAPGAPRAGNRYDMPFTRPPVERGPRTTPRVALRFSGGARGTRHGPAAAVDFRDRPIIARYVCFRLLSSFNPSKNPPDEATVDVGFLGASTLLEASSDPALSELLDVGDGGVPPSLAGAWDLTSERRFDDFLSERAEWEAALTAALNGEPVDLDLVGQAIIHHGGLPGAPGDPPGA